MARLKVLAFNGSPRKGGNTATLLASLAEGVVEGGGEIEIIRTCKLAMQPCIACGGCDETGQCVLTDEMTAIYDKIITADRLVLASPIYFYGISAQAKAVVDRCQALWNRQRLLRQGGHRSEVDPARRGLLLAVAASQGARVFDGAILTAKYAFDAMGFAYGGELLVRGLEHRHDAAHRSEDLQAARRCGRELLG